MKITKKHHANSQLHVVPVQPGHKIELTCPCGPTLKMKNGHLLVDHKPGRGFRGKWRGEVKNYGVKLLGKPGLLLLCLLTLIGCQSKRDDSLYVSDASTIGFSMFDGTSNTYKYQYTITDDYGSSFDILSAEQYNIGQKMELKPKP